MQNNNDNQVTSEVIIMLCCYVVFCYVMLCYVVFCYITLSYVMLFHANSLFLTSALLSHWSFISPA